MKIQKCLTETLLFDTRAMPMGKQIFVSANVPLAFAAGNEMGKENLH